MTKLVEIVLDDVLYITLGPFVLLGALVVANIRAFRDGKSVSEHMTDLSKNAMTKHDSVKDN